MKIDENTFHTFLNSIPMPRFIIGVDAKHAAQVLYVNDAAVRYFDIAREHIVGHKIDDFMPIETVRHFEQSFQVCISRKRIVTVQSVSTNAVDHSDIFSFWVSPVSDDEGEVTHLDVIGQLDDKQHSMLQRERDDAVSFLASVFEVSEVGIIVSDEAGHIIRVNDSFLRAYGWSRDDVMGDHFTSLVTEDERSRIRVNHKKFMSVDMRSSGEVKLLRKDGGVANVLFTSATLNLSQNRKFLITTVMDITVRKKMEESLKVAKDQADSANRSKSNFLANMSHELRTPLNAIIGFSELMIKGTFGNVGNDKYQEYLEDIHMSAGHLLDIINEVLDMSKIEAGRLELAEEEFNVADMVSSVFRMMSSRVFASNIDIVCEVDKNLPPLYADYRLIRQVLINLVMNAIKFSSAGSEIIIKASLERMGVVSIAVVDKGVGIPADKLADVLEPFGQVGNQPDKRDVHQGTGLGLPLAKAMVEMHGGKFFIDSDVGAGTTVQFTIPAFRTASRSS